MRVSRTKRYKKILNYYKKTYQFREPYQIIVTADFIQTTLLSKLNIFERISDVLCGANIKLLVTPCTVAALEALGDLYYGARNQARKFELLRSLCPHAQLSSKDLLNALPTRDISEASQGSLGPPGKEHEILNFCVNCLENIMKSTKNKHHYVIATQSEKLLRKCRKLKGIPLIHIHRNVMILDPLALDAVDTLTTQEVQKTLPSTKEKDIIKSIIPLEKTKKTKDVSVRRRKAKGPNPLSVKKQKPATATTPKQKTNK